VVAARAKRWPPSRGTMGALATAIVVVAITVVGVLVIGHLPQAHTISGTKSSEEPASAFAKSSTTNERAASAPHKRVTAVPASHATPAPGTHVATGKASSATATGAGTRRVVAEARDPEEAKSFPAPATVQHSAAKTPQVAGEAHVAAGAASDAEIRSELARMKQLERAATSPAKMATVPGGNSIVGNDGAIPIPSDVPEVVQRVIAGANAIANFPYVYGGGHASFVDNAYDCSGSVSYALAAGGLLGAPETSGQLESWGAPGPGKWITVYANAGHTYMYVNVGGAWMLYDTAGRSGVFASRWQPYPVDNSGYVVRHWPGL
jgi:cell wall-associated NlpC family hydrolase